MLNMNFDKWRIIKKDEIGYRAFGNKIVTRFPPEPSGYLHIGHIKALLINWVIAKKYGGKMIFRYDDTNPINECHEYETAIIEDVLSLGVEPDKITHSSDYFNLMLERASELVKQGLAYVDDTDADRMSNERINGIDSQFRNRSIEENLELWVNMMNGTKQTGVLRLKFSMVHSNAAMRDPTIYRIINMNHHMTGDKYKVYPTYDFACPLVDNIEGVTHVFRSCEFANRDEQYIALLNLFNLQIPILNTYGKINFEDAVMSKRKIKALVTSGQLEGWNDPRLLTIKGIKRRGLHHDALVDFISRMGFSKNTLNMTQTAVWAINNKIVDKIATRYTGLVDETVSVTVDGDIPDMIMWPRFRRSPQLGNRPIYYSKEILVEKTVVDTFMDGEEITMMSWGNAIVSKVDGVIKLTTKSNGDPKTTDKKVLWLAKRNDKPLVRIQVNRYKGIEDPVVIETFLTETDVTNIKHGEYVQFYTRDYCIRDTDQTFISMRD
jgi:glutamyl-tRNA synthetase